MGDWFLLKTIGDNLSDEWRVFRDIKETSTHWTQEVLPALTEIKQRNWSSARFKQILKPRYPPQLQACQSNLFGFLAYGIRSSFRGLYPELLSELSYYIDQAQSSFLGSGRNCKNRPRQPQHGWSPAAKRV